MATPSWTLDPSVNRPGDLKSAPPVLHTLWALLGQQIQTLVLCSPKFSPKQSASAVPLPGLAGLWRTRPLLPGPWSLPWIGQVLQGQTHPCCTPWGLPGLADPDTGTLQATGQSKIESEM